MQLVRILYKNQLKTIFLHFPRLNKYGVLCNDKFYDSIVMKGEN